MLVNGSKDYSRQFKDSRRLEAYSTFITVKSLYTGSRYNFEVSAVNAGGEGESESINKDTPVSG